MRLLDEPDPVAAEPLISQVSAMSPDDIELVVSGSVRAGKAARLNVHSALVRSRFIALDDDWRKAADPRSVNLEKALSLLCLTGDNPPAVDVPATLDQYADEVGEHLSGDRAFDVGLSVLTEVLYRRHNLRANNGDYYAPENSYLDCVLSTGKGIPISLCTVAILVGRRLELPVAGVGSPGHFLGFYGDVHLRIGSFFDPFDGFRRLNTGELRSLLAHFVEKVEPEMLAPVSDRQILGRFLRNLVGCYTKLGQPEQIRNLERWFQALIP
jgi:regulator of sirC expression with transglutaminase-like and TPR domain